MPSAPSAPSSPSHFSPSLSFSIGIPSRHDNATMHANANDTHHDLPLPLPVTPTCFACKHQRRECGPDCILATYFPQERQHDFQNAHKIFGASNIVNKLHKTPPHDRQKEVDLMVSEETMHAIDPRSNCIRLIDQAQKILTSLQEELSQTQNLLALYRNSPNNFHSNLHKQQSEDQSKSSFSSSEDVNPSENKLENRAQEQLHEYFNFYSTPANGKNNHNTDIGSPGMACSYVNSDNHYHNEVEQESNRDEIGNRDI